MSPLEQELERYLDLSVLQQKVTAENMANVDTPGYRTLGFDFADAMRRSVERLNEEREEQQEAVSGRVEGGDGGPPMAAVSAGVEIHRIGGLLERPDGNDVSVDREGLKMAEAQLQFEIGMQMLKQQFTEINDAIHAGD